MISVERIFIVVGAVVALLLQLLVAPYIIVLSAMPNFTIAFTVAVAIARPRQYGPVLPFVLGLAYDLISGGPVGAMAFSLTLFTYLIARYFDSVGNDSLVMSLAFIVLGVLLVEFSYGIFLLLFGFSANLFEALVYRMAPCFIYDSVLAVVCFFIARRFVQPTGATRADITQLR